MKQFTAEDGVEIAYQEWGPPSDLPPVLLHHGFVADAHVNWVLPGVVGALVDAGRSVVAPDARGHGRSGKPHDPALYGEQAMARDLSTLVDVIGAAEVDLVGYSMGAIVSLIAATAEPRIRRLVVGGVGAAIVELGGVDTRVVPNDALVAALEADDPTTITDPEAGGFRLFADAVGADRLALAAQARSVHASPIALDRITAPTLLLAGEDDVLATRPEVFAGAIAGARLERLTGDHMGAIADPRFIPLIVDFVGAGA
ncbi:MAG TPA: alpha/beta fold hydrolase [Acidimicrobiales bacterium]|nr:alpha/beta fold hydrolase [Acidimicrobiales bacterium]